MNTKASTGTGSSFASEAESEKTMPLGVGEFSDAGLDPLANADERKKFNTGSLVLVLVVAVAGAGLWFMRTVSQVSASSGGSDAEMTISKFLQALQGGGKDKKPDSGTIVGSDMSVLSVLSETYTERQVPLSDVKCNPFILDGETEVRQGPAATDSKPSALAAMRAKFEQAGAEFELKSVIMSSSPLANVSGKIVRVGDEIVGKDDLAFRVSEITSNSITLVGEEPALNLSVPVTIRLKRDL